MHTPRPTRLGTPVDPARDHVLGAADADYTLVEYGSYASEFCHAAHEVVAILRQRFGDQLRYVYRHLPITDRAVATKAAELAEYASLTQDRFWDVHNALMRRSPDFDEPELERLAAELGLPPKREWQSSERKAARVRVREDAMGGLDSGARVTPTFFINGRRYEGAWDESALAEALVGSLGHRLRVGWLEFARWAPSAGLLLLVATVMALVVSNSGLGAAFQRFWQTPFGLTMGSRTFALTLVDWVNHGLLSLFFLLVGLEIKHEFTVGRLASRRAAILPVAAAFGGMVAPALFYLAVLGGGPLAGGWGLTIATDTAFAVAIIVLLRDRVPVDLRVFLTAAVVVDDLVAIAIVALFYTSSISLAYLTISLVIIVLLGLMNRGNVYFALPYVVLGLLLWFCLHEAGIHATLAGVVLALVTPTRPPPTLRALIAQARLVIQAEEAREPDPLQHGPSEATLHALETIHDRVEAPASKLRRSVEVWSSYFVLPIFALANAGLVWSAGLLTGRGRLATAIVAGLVLGKPLGIFAGAWIVTRLNLAQKPEAYSWRQLAGAGALGGIGFTMSLFIAGQAFTDPADVTAAKVAIFLASLIAGILGAAVLWVRPKE